jgi:hypothetical protein
MRARNRVGIGKSYPPARLHRLAESIPGLLQSLKIPPLYPRARLLCCALSAWIQILVSAISFNDYYKAGEPVLIQIHAAILSLRKQRKNGCAKSEDS